MEPPPAASNDFNFMDFAAKTIVGMQTEIMIFVLAFIIHTLVFSKHRCPSTPGAAKRQSRVPRVHDPIVKKRQLVEQHDPPVDFIYKEVGPLVRVGSAPEEVAVALNKVLTVLPKHAAPEALAVFISRLGGLATIEVLSEVRGMRARHNLPFNTHLNEVLLRCYLSCGNVKESRAFVEELGMGVNDGPGISILAMRVALQMVDFEAALHHYCTHRNLRDEPTSLTPPEIQQSMQHLAKFAVHVGKTTAVLNTLKSPPPLPGELEALAVSAARRPDIGSLQALERFGRLHNVALTNATYCVLVKEAQSAEEIMSLLTTADEPNLLCDQRSFHIAVRAALQVKRMDMVERLVMPASKAGNQGSFILLIKSFIADSRLDDAFTIFRAAQSRPSSLYNAMLEGCFECKKPQIADELMAEAVSIGVADVITFNTMIKVHASVGDMATIRNITSRMRELDLEPNYVTFHEILDATAKVSGDEMWAIIDEMKACGCAPNHVTGSILLKKIHIKSKSSHIDRTMALIRGLEDDMDEVLLGSVVEACVRVGRAGLLRPHLQRQRTPRRVQINGAHTFGSIIRAFGFIKDLEGVWETWREMRSRQIVPTSVTLGCMVEAVVTNDGPDSGYKLISHIVQDDQCKGALNAVVYCSVLKGYSRQKRFKNVWALYEEMLGLGVQFSIVTCNTMVDACARCGEMRRVSSVLETLAVQGIEPNLITYSTILKGYCQETRMDKAREVIESMRQTTKFVPDEIMYNTLLDGCARGGLFEEGISVLEEMRNAGVRPSNFTLSVLVKLAGRCKRTDAVFKFVADITKEYDFQPSEHVYANMIHACVCDKDLASAFNVFEQLLIKKVRPDARMYSSLLSGCVSTGLGKDAAGLLRCALGLSGGHPRFAVFLFASLAPHDNLSNAVISETIEGIVSQCHNERLGMDLLRELRDLGLKLDTRFQLRLATSAIAGTNGKQKRQAK